MGWDSNIMSVYDVWSDRFAFSSLVICTGTYLDYRCCFFRGDGQVVCSWARSTKSVHVIARVTGNVSVVLHRFFCFTASVVGWRPPGIVSAHHSSCSNKKKQVRFVRIFVSTEFMLTVEWLANFKNTTGSGDFSLASLKVYCFLEFSLASLILL